jgi:hypothetical protein
MLDHNIVTEVAIRLKRGARDNLIGLAALLQRLLPELGGDGSARAARMLIVLVGALWPRSHPTPAVLGAIEVDPSLAIFLTPFADALERSLATFLFGLLAEALVDEPKTKATRGTAKAKGGRRTKR